MMVDWTDKRALGATAAAYEATADLDDDPGTPGMTTMTASSRRKRRQLAEDDKAEAADEVEEQVAMMALTMTRYLNQVMGQTEEEESKRVLSELNG